MASIGFEWEEIDTKEIENIKVKDIKLDYVPFLKHPSKETVIGWLAEGNETYRKYCFEMSKKYSRFTFKSFIDILYYVAKNKENIVPIKVRKMDIGPIIVCNGKHRWCAAYLLDIEYIPCYFQKEKILVKGINI